MQHTFLDKTLQVCHRIQHSRTLDTIFAHAQTEMVELQEEINKVLNGEPEGPDGVLGESIDVMMCCVDIIYKHNPTITKEEIYAKLNEKLEKWVAVYSEQGKE